MIVRLSVASFSTDAPSPFVDYACSLIELSIGIRLDSGAADVPCIYHGNDDSRPCDLRIPLVARYTTESVPGVPMDEPAGRVFPFDLFAALRFWLADEAHEHAPAQHFDGHGRLLPASSAQTRRRLTDLPIVNAYLLHLRTRLAASGVPGRSLLPAGKRCAIVLSHDVDSPIDPGSPWHAIRVAATSVRSGTRPISSTAYAAGATWRSAVSRFRDPHARHALFADIVDAEERYGFRSTFFFAPTSRFAPAGCRRDVGYDVSRPPLPDVLRLLRTRGSGIGLHVGYLAAPDASRIAMERERLEEVAGRPVCASRHHYYHLGNPFWDTLAAHGEAGLTIDSSLCLNYVPGYRLGAALPFRPWNPRTETAVSTIQVPTVLMDSMLFGDEHATHEEAMGRIEQMLSGLKRFEGVAAIDWHEYTSYPGSSRYRDWGRGYLALLELLSADPEIAVLTYEEAAALHAAEER